MSILTGTIGYGGPEIIVDVAVGQAKLKLLQKLGMPIPSPVRVTALIDTGSPFTAFHPTIYGQLNLRPVGRISVLTPTNSPDNPCDADQFDVSVTLAASLISHTFDNIFAISAVGFMADEHIQALIGRDVLTYCHFAYNGPSRSYQLAIP